MSRFSGIPAVPFTGLDPAQARVLSAIKENVELLTGGRGESDGASRALTRGQINVQPLPQPAFGNPTARGDGVGVVTSVSFDPNTGLSGETGTTVSIDDYRRALDDIERLARDVQTLQQYVRTLVQQLRG